MFDISEKNLLLFESNLMIHCHNSGLLVDLRTGYCSYSKTQNSGLHFCKIVQLCSFNCKNIEAYYF